MVKERVDLYLHSDTYCRGGNRDKSIETCFAHCTYVTLALNVWMCKASFKKEGSSADRQGTCLLLLQTVGQSVTSLEEVQSANTIHSDLLAGAFVKLLKAIIRSVIYVCPSDRLLLCMEELGSHWTDFHEI